VTRRRGHSGRGCSGARGPTRAAENNTADRRSRCRLSLCMRPPCGSCRASETAQASRPGTCGPEPSIGCIHLVVEVVAATRERAGVLAVAIAGLAAVRAQRRGDGLHGMVQSLPTSTKPGCQRCRGPRNRHCSTRRSRNPATGIGQSVPCSHCRSGNNRTAQSRLCPASHRSPQYRQESCPFGFGQRCCQRPGRRTTQTSTPEIHVQLAIDWQSASK
jgi:hypothetical protein